MQKGSLSVDDSIEARCTKCRKNTTHIIVTMAAKGADEVKCNSCQRQHKFRPPIVATSPAVRQALQRNNAERKEWELLCAKINSAKATDYSMTKSYKVKEVISHPVFGLGLVQRQGGMQKIEVLFEEGKKMMRCK